MIHNAYKDSKEIVEILAEQTSVEKVHKNFNRLMMCI